MFSVLLASLISSTWCERGVVDWAPPVFIPLPPWRTGKRRMPPLVLMKWDWFRSFFSRFSVETVHNCGSEFHWCISAWFVQWDFPVFLVSLVLLCQFWVAMRITIYWISLETIVNFIKFLFDTSLPRVVPRNALSVPPFCRAGWRGHPIAIDQHFDWIRFQPRDVHKCSRSLLDCTFGIVSHNSKNSILPISRIIAFESSLNGLLTFFACKLAWSASRWGWLSIFFTSSRTRKFSACFTTARGNPDTLKSMSISSRGANKPMDCSPFVHWCFRSQARHVCRFLEHSNRMVVLS